MRVLTTCKEMMKGRRRAAVGGVWFRGLLCSVWRNTSGVVLVLLSSPRFFGNPLINEAQQLISYINDTT